MAELKEALASVAPIDFTSLPSNLESFLRDSFRHGELIVNSIPPSPDAPNSLPPPSSTTPNAAQKASDTYSPASSTILDSRNADLQKSWGKPVKINAKDNPLGVVLYKMSGQDKGATWFARRSVHQGIGFEKWKNAWLAEFGESEKVEGGPGAGAIRGITADRRVETKQVDGVGAINVWQLSAAFPGPTSPREFIELLLSSTNALSSSSALNPNSSSEPPRHLMVISRPTTHPDAPPRQNLVQGKYESVEMIRELPVEGQKNPELNPVEWLMITRSDPGGGIPRFLVERGTPGSVVGDMSKFLDWACKWEGAAGAEVGGTAQKEDLSRNERTAVDDHEIEKASLAPPSNAETISSPSSITTAPTNRSSTPPTSTTSDSMTGSGILSSAAAYVGQTASAAAGLLPAFGYTEGATPAEHDSSAPSPASDTDSFLSADEGTDEGSAASPVRSTFSPQTNRPSTPTSPARSTMPHEPARARAASASSSLRTLLLDGHRGPSNQHEKELLKIQKRIQDHEAKTLKEREEDDAKTAEFSAPNVEEKVREAHVKARAKREEKSQTEMKKLQDKLGKEETKVIEHEKKDRQKREDRLNKEAHQRRKDEGKEEIARLKKELVEKEEERKAAEHEAGMLKEELDRLRKDMAVLRARAGGSGVVVDGAATEQ